jgi:hypothetical protein
MSNGPIPVLCRYRVKPGMEKEFAALLREHWPTLQGAGLVGGQPAKVLRGEDQAGNIAYIETFAWKDAASIGAAHQSAAVMKMWEPMGALCLDMEFWHVQEIAGHGKR